jgi:hypothetical protein
MSNIQYFNYFVGNISLKKVKIAQLPIGLTNNLCIHLNYRKVKKFLFIFSNFFQITS